MSEGGGSLCTYSVEVAAFETHTGICDKAADELVHTGFARKVEFGEMLALDQKVSTMFFCLGIAANRSTLAA